VAVVMARVPVLVLRLVYDHGFAGVDHPCIRGGVEHRGPGQGKGTA